MKPFDPIETLSRLQEEIREIESIEKGGCGVFAALVAKRLKKKNIPVHLRVGDDFVCPERLDHARSNNARRKDDYSYHGVGFGHVIVEFEHDGRVYHFDNLTLTEKQERTNVYGLALYPQSFSVFEMLQISRGQSGWNRMFNRKQIPKLAKKIQEVFS